MKSCALQLSDYLQIGDGKEDEWAWAGLRMNHSAQDSSGFAVLLGTLKISSN
jgi:hypothetical protein